MTDPNAKFRTNQANIFKNMLAVGACQMITACYIIIYADVTVEEVIK